MILRSVRLVNVLERFALAANTGREHHMASRRGWSWLILAVGILLALVSLFADPLGLGAMPVFGWKQTIGLAVGLVLVALGGWRLR
jgi:hypothetical protein